MRLKAVADLREVFRVSETVAHQVETYVSFRISGLDLDIAEITSRLNLAPNATHRVGERPRDNSRFAPYRQSQWSLDSKLSLSESLEAHLLALLNLLEPHCDYLQALAKVAEVNFYSTVFNKNGMQLSAQVLRRIAELGSGFTLTIYPGSDEQS